MEVKDNVLFMFSLQVSNGVVIDFVYCGPL